MTKKPSLIYSDKRDGSFTSTTKATITYFDRLYFRFMAPRTALIINGDRSLSSYCTTNQEIEMTDFAVFDNTLEKAFETPIEAMNVKTDTSTYYPHQYSDSVREPHIGSGG